MPAHRIHRRLPVSPVVVIAISLCGSWFALADEPPANSGDIAAEKAALAAFNGLIGGWRGAGQVRRGSNQGAWTESADWIWDFENGVAIVYNVADGKHLKAARLTYDAESKAFHLRASLPDDSQREYRGAIEKERLVVESPTDDAGEVHRLTLTQLNPKRTLVLFEKRRETQKSWQRVAEVGYTREGTQLAGRNSSEPECVVTGGLGTIAVAYKGKTYFVCCSGCKEAFDDDPEEVLAEYAARKREEAID